MANFGLIILLIGFYVGYTSIILRDVPFSGIFFFVYEYLKK